MINSSVTISLVPEARSGPFVYHGELDRAVDRAAALGFDAVELFLPAADTLDRSRLRQLLRNSGVALSALGTGAGFLTKGWTLCTPENSISRKAVHFVSQMIDLGAEFQAPAIIGSMKGSVGNGEDRGFVFARLIENLNLLAEKAAECDTTILLEPLNRYETNLINRLEEGVTLLEKLDSERFRLLADLFHMNIEEASISEALKSAGRHLGYIHFVDSNRRPAGFGHLNFRELAAAIREIGYEGFLSAEALPFPDSDQAAGKTLATFKEYFQPD